MTQHLLSLRALERPFVRAARFCLVLALSGVCIACASQGEQGEESGALPQSASLAEDMARTERALARDGGEALSGDAGPGDIEERAEALSEVRPDPAEGCVCEAAMWCSAIRHTP